LQGRGPNNPGQALNLQQSMCFAVYISKKAINLVGLISKNNDFDSTSNNKEYIPFVEWTSRPRHDIETDCAVEDPRDTQHSFHNQCTYD
jgi:hypothetical protein